MTNLWSLLMLILKRLWHNRGLSISSLVGIISILTIAVCVPVFSSAISSDVLQRQLLEKVSSTQRPLFALHLTYAEQSQSSQMTIDKSKAITEYLQSAMTRLVDIPVQRIVVNVQTALMSVTSLTGRAYDTGGSPLTRWRFVVQPTLPDYITLAEGTWPELDTSGSGPIQVVVSNSMADKMFLNIGDHFMVGPLEVQIVGFIQVQGVFGSIWYNNPDSEYDNAMWIPESTYRARIIPAVDQPLEIVTWYVMTDESSLNFQNASLYAHGLVRMAAELRQMLPGITFDYSPMDPLAAYEKRAATLTTLFYAVGSPMIVLALLFITLTARISVQQYETETATMRGRGTSPTQVLFMNLVEGILLIILAFPFSLLTGAGATEIMGKTVSFLKFADRPVYPFSLAGLNIWIITITVIAILAARFFPMASMSHISILRVKHEQARGSAKPFWERYFLDFLLLIPGGYALFIMNGWAKPAQFLVQMLESDSAFRDPLLFIAPALFALAACMITLRFIPLLIKLLALVTRRGANVWAYLSIQQIARRSQDHATVMLLIMISLALSIFSTSTAKTLDQWLYDSEQYKVGADLALKESITSGSSTGGMPSSTGAATSSFTSQGPLTREEHLALPGVKSMTRVGYYGGNASYYVGDMAVTVMGIDRVDFPTSAFYRDDFAQVSLGELMNALGMNLSGILVPRLASEKTGIALGDKLNLTVSLPGGNSEREMVVVGFYDYFPTIYPVSRPTIIANLESLFDNPEDVEGYVIWLNLKEGAVQDKVIEEIRQEMGPQTAAIEIQGDAIREIKTGQEKPERTGLFGVLNVGFIATGLMPGIGFLLYSFSLLRRRFIQLGILRAIGLSVEQLVAYLASEQFILMGLALVSGAAVGLLTSILFVPYLQVGVTPGIPIPPFKVLIGWTEAGWLSLAFGAVLMVTIIGTIIYLVRLKVFQAVKLGETI